MLLKALCINGFRSIKDQPYINYCFPMGYFILESSFIYAANCMAAWYSRALRFLYLWGIARYGAICTGGVLNCGR